MKNFVVIVAAAILLGSGVKCVSQVNPDRQLAQINMATPNAAALGKYLDFPVNLHTGIPDINIPIYTIKEGSLTFPISLSYNASGIKVAEMASWVGLGWALNANGVISRTVKGLPDEKIYPGPSGFSSIGFYKDHGYSGYLTNEEGNLDYLEFAEGRKDGEPDLFFFNFNGYSGKFVFGEDNIPVIIPHQNIKIEPIFCKPGEACVDRDELLRSWKLTTPDGVKYYFGMSLNNATHGTPAIEKLHFVSEREDQLRAKFISSWFVYKIESADGKSVINFKYAPEEYSHYSLAMGSHRPMPYNAVEDRVLVKNNVEGLRLETISFSQGTLTFIPDSEPRQDIGNSSPTMTQVANTETKALKRIEITNGGDYCKAYSFEYDYFVANPEGLRGPLSGYEQKFRISIHKRRLKLNAFQERSCNGKITVPKMEFDYYEDGTLPSTLSFAVDHWGFYNGRDLNNWLIPSVSLDGGATYTINGADREADVTKMKIGTLRTIYQPLGGYTRFDYFYDMVTVRPTGGAGVTRYIGGNRINQIIDYDLKGNMVKRKNFNYPSGVILFSVPNYVSLIRNPALRFTDQFHPSVNGCMSGTSNVPPYEFTYSTASVHPMQTTLGSHKGYETVHVTELDGSRSIYQYDISQAPDISRDVSRRIINIQQCDGSEPIYPPVPENQPLKRGLLLLEQHMDPTHPYPIKEISYEYEFKVDRVGVHGLRVGTISAFGTKRPAVEYQVKSGYKVKETKIEKSRSKESSAIQEVKTVTLFSKYLFNKATEVSLYETVLGQWQPVKKKQVTYAKDFSPCKRDPSDRGSGYLGMLDDRFFTYQANNDRCKTQSGRESICNELEGCEGRPNDPCNLEFECQACAYADYQIKRNRARLLYIDEIVGARESDCLTNLAPVSDSGYQVILDLNKQNNVAVNVENTDWKYGRLVKSSFLNYSAYGGSVLVDNIQQVDTASPLAYEDFDSARIENDALLKYVGYNSDPEAKYKYDNGRVVEVQSKSAPLVSYIWDLVEDNILVKGENIGYLELKAAYESALTSGPVGSAAFNTQLRALANSAMITTYAHRNLVGITSVTDPNNITTFYEYDDLGRLKIVKDYEGSIVKYYDYQYNLKR